MKTATHDSAVILALLIAGLALIVVSAGWLTAMGVFLIVWANNIDSDAALTARFKQVFGR